MQVDESRPGRFRLVADSHFSGMTGGRCKYQSLGI